MRTSGQDGGVSRYTMPHCTTKRRTTINLKTKKQPQLPENRTVWKCDNQGVKQETFIKTGRRGRDGQPGGEDSQQCGGWRTQRGGGLWSSVGKAAAGQRGSSYWAQPQTKQPRVLAWGNKASKPLTENTCFEAAGGETPSLTGEFAGETHRVLEHTQTRPPGNQHQKGPICLWLVEEVTESWLRAEQVPLFPLWPLPIYSTTTQWPGLPCPGKYIRLCPLQHNRYAKTKKYGPNERTDQTPLPNRTKWWRDSQLIRCRAQNIGNQDVRRNGWVWLQNRGKSEGKKSQIKGSI